MLQYYIYIINKFQKSKYVLTELQVTIVIIDFKLNKLLPFMKTNKII